MKKDLAIGMACNMKEEHLAIFAGSLREWSATDSCDIVIFLNEPSINKKMQALLKKLDVIVVPFKEDELLPLQLQGFHPSTYRWPLIYEYIRRNAGIYNRVLMADVRDTCFQQNPFEIMLPSDKANVGFYAFHGVESRSIGQCGWNGGWIRDCFGPEILQEMYDKAIICSGISIGYINEVKEYLKLMTKTILSTSGNPDFTSCERNGVDQGVHNVLLHR